VPTIDLATAEGYSVLAGQTITNTGSSTLAQSAGVSPGNAVVGLTPVMVGGTIEAGTAPALQAQSELTAAYVDAAGRPVNATTTSELGGLTLVGGVYSGPSKSPLELTGTVVLDGQGDPNSVFIFQTDSTLVTASGSTVSLINGAQECNVFWQIGSSATLGTSSVFAGNILALTSITVTNGVTVHGRALARNGAVTLDNDVFTTPTCDLAPIPSTTTAGATTTAAGGATTLAPTSTPTTAASPSSTFPFPTTPGTPSLTLPPTGNPSVGWSVVGGASLALGVVAIMVARRRPVTRS
jgi:type VI secretion system secreted protein VgrG